MVNLRTLFSWSQQLTAASGTLHAFRQPAVMAAAVILSSQAALANNSVTWKLLGNSLDADGKPQYVQRFTVQSDTPFERLAFCQFKRKMTPANPSDTLIELLPGYFAIASPRFENAASGPVDIDIITAGTFRNASYAPDGMHLVIDGKPVAVETLRESTVLNPKQWINPANGADGMIYGPQAFAINDSLRSSSRPAPYASVPTPKSIQTTGRMISAPTTVKVITSDDPRHDYYRATIDADTLLVVTSSAYPQAVADRMRRRIAFAADEQGLVPEATIEDWADLPYRGLMIDVARNFTSPDDMKQIIDLMGTYGLNTLHFHLGDDEGWRVETPSLPELTAVGSRRGYTTTDDCDFLKGIYSGNGNPDDLSTPANGFYTKAEYIDLLKYAAGKGVDIIPEFDSPGHSRAAIRAMESRYRHTGNPSLRLIQDGDTSRYTGAQGFHDNIMNPALDGPYSFWEIVFDDMIAIYAEAGVPLKAVHIGGDEVPAHAWDGSSAARQLMADNGMTHQRELHAYFARKVADIARSKGLKIAGWQEIALNHSDDYDKAVVPTIEAINCWTNAGNLGQQIASKGYPLILSNVDCLYFDQTPTTHPEEPGLTWGGIVDEFRPLHATVDLLCPGPEDLQANVKGISGQLFAETVRSRAMIERYILPRMLGLAERAHNSRPTLSDEEFMGILTEEMPRWAADGHNFFVRQPGIRVNDQKLVEMNDAYGFGQIRYTLDGSIPTADSPVYTGPFNPGDAQVVNARLFIDPAVSVTSILYLDPK